MAACHYEYHSHCRLHRNIIHRSYPIQGIDLGHSYQEQTQRPKSVNIRRPMLTKKINIKNKSLIYKFLIKPL